MPKLRKLYEKALQSANNVSFNDLCSLAEAVGFVFERQKGSHCIYKHDGIKGHEGFINIQDFNGKAKPYQVRQILNMIEQYDLMRGR